MKGIMMLDILLRQTLAGNKDMTRRSGGLQEVNDTSIEMNGHVRSPDDWFKGKMYKIQTDASITLCNQMFRSKRRDHSIICKPRYNIGEVIFIKEPWVKTRTKVTFAKGDGPYSIHFEVVLRYNFDENRAITRDMRVINVDGIKWKNKMFMPASAARTFIKITDIKCERLLDISDQDCVAEGIQSHRSGQGFIDYGTKDGFGFLPWAKQSFLSLFRFANKIKPTAEIGNPWVWSYTFQLVNKPE